MAGGRVGSSTCVSLGLAAAARHGAAETAARPVRARKTDGPRVNRARAEEEADWQAAIETFIGSTAQLSCALV